MLNLISIFVLILFFSFGFDFIVCFGLTKFYYALNRLNMVFHLRLV